jgi:hypothetical protein
MAKQLPAGFDKARIMAGLKTAMQFGAPTRVEDQATFYKVVRTTDDVPRDDDFIPFDPDAARTAKPTGIRVDCSVEYVDRSEVTEQFGTITPSRIKVTLLDPEYQKVKGFEYVVAGGDKYNYVSTEPPVALGNIDVWTVHCEAEDER